MTETPGPDPRDTYQVRARNYARDSENQIHDDRVAGRYGFRGGLVPGVSVYGYLTVPVIRKLGAEWFRRGFFHAKFVKPIYEDELVEVHTAPGGNAAEIALRASGEDGIDRAFGTAGLHDLPAPSVVAEPGVALPAGDARPEASAETMVAGKRLASLEVALGPWQERFLEALDERLEVYQGVVHPAVYLALANEILVRNFRINPWIHSGSRVWSFGAASPAALARVAGSIGDVYERKGHQLVDLALVVTADGVPVHQILHTAIWRLAGEVVANDARVGDGQGIPQGERR